MRPENTEIRKEIFEIISNSKVPMAVNDVSKKMRNQADVVTLYRGLSYLEKKNKIKGFFFACNNKRVKRLYYHSTNPHIHFLHCEMCHSFLPFYHCEQNKEIPNIENKYSFKIKSHFLSFNGICKNCT